MPERIFLSPPHQTGNEQRYLDECLSLNWIAPAGPHLEQLERKAAEATGVAGAVAVASGTAAIHLALLHLGVERGDEVICSTLTFCASANPIMYQGAKPVFIDADRSWNMDPNLLEDEIRAMAARGVRPKAIIAVDLFGQCCDYDSILEIAGRHGIPVIEDAAESLGATYMRDGQSHRAGSAGWCSIISLNGNKIITAGGGGLLCSNDTRLLKAAQHLATQARDPAPHYQHSQVGYNYRMSNVSAAIGVAQFEALAERVQQRRQNFQDYARALGSLPGITMMPESPHGRSNRWLATLQIEAEQFGASREQVSAALAEDNIESRPVWKPLHCQPVFLGSRCRGGKVAESLFRNGLCLPSGSALTSEQKQRVVDRVRATPQSQPRGSKAA